jgi:class 3 adenylate cyclase
LLRDQLESYGGTVEKFIGDAVVGVFGAPPAHDGVELPVASP